MEIELVALLLREGRALVEEGRLQNRRALHVYE